MMERIAALGGGRYFDASDGAAVAEALKSAIAASYRAVDAAGTVVASGQIGGQPQALPPGWYTVEIAAADGPRRSTEVRIDPDLMTTLEVNKVGSEMDVAVLAPREHEPLVECGKPAIRRGDDERVRRIQTQLQNLGFDPGPSDNLIGAGTRRAIASFLSVHGLQLEPEPTLLIEQHLDCISKIGAPFRDAQAAVSGE